MSQFPRRLIDEPGDSPGRRMLEKARGDAPPAKAVAAAILAATRSAGATAEPNPSTNEPNGPSTGASRTGSSGTTRTLTSKKLALIAATAIVGTALLWGATHGFEPASNRAPNDPPSTSALSAPANATVAGEVTANAPTTPSLPAPLAPAPVAEAMPSTSVADLPNANAPHSPSSLAPAATLPHASNTQPPPHASSADLLREANQLRAQNQWDAAAALYEKVITLGPSSAEAYPANVALGNLELQRNRPAAALARYDHALKMQPSGALAEEARWGKARALRASGRVAEERAALEDFRAHHPESLLAPGAVKRLSEIGN